MTSASTAHFSAGNPEPMPSLWQIKQKSLPLPPKAPPLLLGILNTTPDSFSDGGAFLAPAEAVAHARSMLALGADIIDVGGESTRPGARPVPVEEELRRTIPVIEHLATLPNITLSIDTRKPTVARAALQAGAHIVNDVNGLRDPEMREAVAEHRAGAIVMHMQNAPETMQDQPSYHDLLGEIRAFFENTTRQCEKAGIPQDALLFDPGIGFGKTQAHNLSLLANLHQLLSPNGCSQPERLALGVSRKSFLQSFSADPSPHGRHWPTVALSAFATEKGCGLVRVHEILDNRHATLMAHAINLSKPQLPCAP